jgi:hypothetical protein
MTTIETNTINLALLPLATAKRKAMAKAKEDFAKGVYGNRYVFHVWGGDDGYQAEKDGIYLISRHDGGGTKGIRCPDRLVVKAEKMQSR